MLMKFVMDADDEVEELQALGDSGSLTLDIAEMQNKHVFIMDIDGLLRLPTRFIEAMHNVLADEPLNAEEWSELKARTRFYLESIQPETESDNDDKEDRETQD